MGTASATHLNDYDTFGPLSCWLLIRTKLKIWTNFSGKTELEKRIKKKTYTKILFENDKWIKPSYQNKYEDELIETYKEIVKFIKIYKKSTAGESF